MIGGMILDMVEAAAEGIERDVLGDLPVGLAGERLAVMAGHAQGLVAIGGTLADAAGRILALASA